jgi:hypothetical protein
VLLRLTRLGLRLIKGMLLADEAGNNIGVFFIKVNRCKEETVGDKVVKPRWLNTSNSPVCIRKHITNG